MNSIKDINPNKTSIKKEAIKITFDTNKNHTNKNHNLAENMENDDISEDEQKK
ncbi:hypothetical protein [Methanobrevibacter arboriphilus]|uniref:hypothetical protein n=1 Tax=Methanobrevibacter arboriphilus TaxID=39441 RepID=UPI000ABF06AD|nr:hypothetical protein [Methanobrevibacter arboriphilus]